MAQDDFIDAFLDSQYLKLDRGALDFIFTRERVERAMVVNEADVTALVETRRDELAAVYADTARRILVEPFYIKLFEALAELEDDLAVPFINLALGRVTDDEVEAARVAVVKEFQSKLKRKPAGH